MDYLIDKVDKLTKLVSTLYKEVKSSYSIDNHLELKVIHACLSGITFNIAVFCLFFFGWFQNKLWDKVGKYFCTHIIRELPDDLIAVSRS